MKLKSSTQEKKKHNWQHEQITPFKQEKISDKGLISKIVRTPTTQQQKNNNSI